MADRPTGGVIFDLANLDAITEYMNDLRPKVATHKTLGPVLDNYSNWLGALGWWDKHMNSDDTIAKAVFFRNQANTILNEKIPETSTRGDAGHTITPRDPKDTSHTGVLGTLGLGSKSTASVIKYGFAGVVIIVVGILGIKIVDRLPKKRAR